MRKDSGQGMAEGGATLIVITITAIGLLLLIVNLGMSTYYKQKLGFICCQAAQFAANDVAAGNSGTAQTDTQTMVNTMSKAFGLSNVTVSKVDTSNTPQVTVTLTATNLPLIGNGSIVPMSISMLTDTSAALPGGTSTGTGGGSSGTAGYVVLGTGGGSTFMAESTNQVVLPSQILIPFTTSTSNIPPRTPLMSLGGFAPISTVNVTTDPGNGASKNNVPVYSPANGSWTSGNSVSPYFTSAGPASGTFTSGASVFLQAGAVGVTSPNSSGNGSVVPTFPGYVNGKI